MIVMMELLKKRTFTPLFLTQFFGAFNDNAFKFAMLTLISYYLTSSQNQSELYQALAGALYIAPFFFLSATAGQLADKFNKALLTRLIKFFEIIIVSTGSMALYFGNTMYLMATLLGLGIHSTFFGPIKYAILPEQLPCQSLLGATALIEASTFLAILFGTVLGTLSIGGIKAGAWCAILLTGVVAIAGFIASLFILPGKNIGTNLRIEWNFVRATSQMIKEVLLSKNIGPIVFAISWFWLIGAVMLTKLPDYTSYVLRADKVVFSVFLSLFSIGIALGSMSINRILNGRITIKYVPHSMFLLSLFGFDLYLSTPTQYNTAYLQGVVQFFSQLMHWRIAVDLFFLAFSAGLFVVPLYTYLQVAGDGDVRARTIASNNIFNALFMISGTCLVMVLLHLHVPIAAVFFILSILNCCSAIIFWFIFPKV